MAIQFQRAQRKRAKLRAAMTGPAGCGKSKSALLLAKGLGERIAAIDTESGSLSLYSSDADFDVIELEAPFTPERYIEAIKAAEEAGYGTIIIDSLSHEWIGKGGLLEIHDAMPGNSFANWGKITPRHQKLVDAILTSKCHVIATMRSKSEYLQTEENGKKRVEKVGLAPQQRDGMDFEFTICLDIQQKNHVAAASKDRTGLWDQRYEIITEAHGRELKAWLDGAPESKPEPKPEAKPIEPKSEPATSPAKSAAEVSREISEIRKLMSRKGIKSAEEAKHAVAAIISREVEGLTSLSNDERAAVLAEMRK